MMGSSESLYKKKGYTLGGEQSLSLELSICTHGSELKTDGLTLRPGSKSSRLNSDLLQVNMRTDSNFIVLERY